MSWNDLFYLVREFCTLQRTSQPLVLCQCKWPRQVQHIDILQLNSFAIVNEPVGFIFSPSATAYQVALTSSLSKAIRLSNQTCFDEKTKFYILVTQSTRFLLEMIKLLTFGPKINKLFSLKYRKDFIELDTEIATIV